MNGPSLCHKRGDSFVFQGKVDQNGQPVDLTGWAIRSQVRLGDELVDELEIEIIDAAAGVFRAKSLDTSAWPLATLKFDVHYLTAEGYTHTTPTGTIAVQEGGTYGP